MLKLKLFKEQKDRIKSAEIFWLSLIENDIQVLFLALDASWKIPAGVMDGNIYWLGDYRECMNTKNFHYCTMADIMLFNQLVFICSQYHYCCISWTV